MNAKINKRKSKIIPLIAMAERIELNEMKDYGQIKEKETFNILGYKIRRDGFPEKNYCTNKVEEIKRLIEKFSKRNLSLRGKILVAKTLVLS